MGDLIHKDQAFWKATRGVIRNMGYVAVRTTRHHRTATPPTGATNATTVALTENPPLRLERMVP